MKNAQLEKEILDNKKKVNFFANKGGKMRKLASKLKEEIDDLEENKVDVRREDKTIKEFTIPSQGIVGNVVTIKSLKINIYFKKLDFNLWTCKIIRKYFLHCLWWEYWFS